MTTIYKIQDKNTGLFSQGAVMRKYKDDHEFGARVRWSKKGKEWKSVETVKAHLIKCIQGGGIPDSWEILEFTQQPSKAMHEWITAEMTLILLKTKHK